MSFPATRLRRLRQSEALRRLIGETSLSVEHLVAPLFVRPGKRVRAPIASMLGQFQFSVDQLVKECRQLAALKIPAVLLFGIPPTKDERASGAYARNGIVQQAVRAIKAALPKLLVITDVCLCEYMSHGHCGVVKDVRGRGQGAGGRKSRVPRPMSHVPNVDNDASIELLARVAVSHVEAGADIVAPSDMMDGRVGAIRRALDSAGHQQTPILSYAAKYASSFYGPFREAAGSTPAFGDRRGYQMDPANAEEALREVALDINEGADIVMVKPALAYLDIIRRVKETLHVPVAAYNVSGEYAMVQAAARHGWLAEQPAALEILTSIKRAGADVIITYWAKDAATWLPG